MNIADILETLNRRWKLLLRLLIVVLILLVIIDTIPALVDKDHAYTALDRIPGFWSVFGFFGCIFFVFFSKLLGKIGIWQREDYYDD